MEDRLDCLLAGVEGLKTPMSNIAFSVLLPQKPLAAMSSLVLLSLIAAAFVRCSPLRGCNVGLSAYLMADFCKHIGSEISDIIMPECVKTTPSAR